jgi:ABC-2 type transport system permease protein
MRQALHAEWTKLRTLSGTRWLLLATFALTVAVSVLAAAVSYPHAGATRDLTKLSLTGIQLGQAFVALLAVLAISNEYSNGMIRTTLAAIPRRPTVLVAKAAAVGIPVMTVGTISVFACLFLGRLILTGRGFTHAHGYTSLSLLNGATLRAAAGSVIYLVLIALLSLGVATALRDSATAIGAVLGLLYLFPIASALVTDPLWQRHLEQIGPMTAGLAIQATTSLRHLPIGPWAGLGVLTAWTATALLTGGLLLRQRDA